VIAGVRRPEDGESLAHAQPERVTPVTVDITDSDQLAALDESLPASLDAVVNNAGVVVAGPVETTPPDELLRQLEVNVVGQAAVTQAVLPRLRESRGRVVFVSSLSGRIATPMFGPYNASKFALEGLADALRLELAPWAIRVVLIEPAETDTDLWRHADTALDDGVARLAPEQRRLYAKHFEGFRKTIPRSQRAAGSPDRVAATIEKALTDRRPRARYVVGASARSQALVTRLNPTPALDALLRAGGGVPREP
jgi:NAD(P)-dependent dehydrogenase (short-subunit alcohol dehydrogenase family)